NVEGNGERNRAFSIIKVRGMPHSNQLREFVLSEKGIQLLDVYKGSEGVFFGSARITQESRETIDRLHKNKEIERKKRELESKRKLMENEIAALRERYARDEEEMQILIDQDISRKEAGEKTEKEIATQRQVDR
ncbi:MAG: KaiC 1, partial [Methanoregulaceae archaeon]|nr:KaiC 1 [Methanoregulaceae archaeon]